MARLGGSVPTLDKMIQEVEHFVDSEKTYNDVPHILDITLPLLCAYLPFFWSQGPDNNTTAAPELVFHKFILKFYLDFAE